MITAEIIEGSVIFEQLADRWNQLAQGGVTDTPFQSLAYQSAWWKHLQPEDSRLFSVVVSKDGVLAGVGCFYLLGETLHFNGCIEETDYLDIIAKQEDAAAVWTAVFDCLCSSQSPQWTRMDLCNIPETSPSRSLIQKEAEQRGLLFHEEQIEVCPIIKLPGSFDQYLDQIDSKQRREIQRKLRRANGADTKLITMEAIEDLDSAVDDFLDLLQKSTFEKQEWLNFGRRSLFYDVARAARETGTLQLLFLEVEGQKAAALFNFDYANRIWVYNSGLDPDNFSALSLGVVMTAKAIEWAAENGRSAFDFLRGNETYKYRFGAEDSAIYRQIISRSPQQV